MSVVSLKTGFVSCDEVVCLFAVWRSAPCQNIPALSGMLKEPEKEVDWFLELELEDEVRAGELMQTEHD